MNPLLRAWRASFTRRWHSNPDLCDTVDPISSHQGRTALLLVSLFPDCSFELLRAALIHDQAEVRTGDLPYDVKRDCPGAMDILRVAEVREMEDQNLDFPELPEPDQRRLKLCDRLDAWLWMMRHARHLSARRDWKKQHGEMLALALSLGVGSQVADLLRAEESRA